MCGFIGRVTPIPGAPRPSLRRAHRWIARRGPDDAHGWTSSCRRVDLHFARLAIVDPDPRARQPFHDARRGLTVVFNGEIYNHRELRCELSERRFQTTSDTEVLLAVLDRWGLAGARRLRGMFSAAVVDERQGRLHLLRDPVGKKPLFVARWGGDLIFGSSLLAMVALSRQAPSTDEEAAAAWWGAGYVAPSRALLQGAAPVLPGRAQTYDLEGRLLADEDVRPGPEPVPAASEGGDGVSQLIEQAVVRRLRDNPAPVSLLSGGVDSTVVTEVAARSTSIRAVTLGGRPWMVPDARYARAAARRLGVPLAVATPRLGRLSDEASWALDLQDEPLGSMAFLPLAVLVRSVAAHGRIVLTGDGGDEAFLGYGRAEDWCVPVGHPAPRPEGLPVGPALPPWMSAWGQRSSTYELLGHMLPKLDRATAEQGVEARCPFLDWDLLARLRSLPPDRLLPGGVMKGRLKAELRGWPRRFVARRKVGFTYRLRWLWGLSGYDGLRDLVQPQAVARFASNLPPALRGQPGRWTWRSIHASFPAVWRLLAWSAWERRLRSALDDGREVVASGVGGVGGAA